MGCLHTYIVRECLRVHRYAQLRSVKEADFASWLSSDVGSIDDCYRIRIEPLIKFASLQDSGHLFILLWAAVYNGGPKRLSSQVPPFAPVDWTPACTFRRPVQCSRLSPTRKLLITIRKLTQPAAFPAELPSRASLFVEWFSVQVTLYSHRVLRSINVFRFYFVCLVRVCFIIHGEPLRLGVKCDCTMRCPERLT